MWSFGLSLDFPIFPFLFIFFISGKKQNGTLYRDGEQAHVQKKNRSKKCINTKGTYLFSSSNIFVRSRNISYVSSGRGRGPQHSRNSRTRQCDVISNPIQIVESTHERSESTYRCTLFGNRGYGTLFFSFTNHLLIHHRSSSLPHRREEFGTLNVKFFIHRVQIFNT